MRANKVVCFFIGFLVSTTVVLTLLFVNREFRKHSSVTKTTKLSAAKIFYNFRAQDEVNNQNLAELLFEKVKILCIVLTHPQNHKTKAIHVKNTWGQKCNKLLFVSSKPDESLEIISYSGPESRDALWNKTKTGFKFAYENYIDEFDWFLKADDDR